jgi:O-antigen ligase
MRVTVGKRVLWDPVKIKARDWLLIAGLTLAPMTSLRIWKIGPGEVLCLLWGIKYLFSTRIKHNDISFFFILFISALGLGSLAGYIIAPNELRVSDLLTWIYLGVVAISSYNGLKCNSKEYNERLFSLFGTIAMLWYLFLFLYSRYVSRYFLGAPLWYSGRRFSGGATNPHQVAVLLCALCFIFIRQILLKRNLLISIFGLAVSLYLIIGTDSSTAIMSVALGILIGAYFYVADHAGENRKKIMIVMTVIIILVAVVGFGYFWDLFIKWVEKDSNGLGRLGIFSSFPNTFVKSPIVGLGPGVHGRNGLIEFHNTYLEVLAASGILGGIVFLVFSIRIFKKTISADWKLLIIIISMYAYGLAGFAMRRLVFWGIIAFVVAIAEQKNDQEQTIKLVNVT